jgi:protein transport protein SEC24
MYHALGTGSSDPNGTGRRDEPNPYRPPVAASPAGYQQSGSPAIGQTPNQYTSPPAQYNTPTQQESYFPQQPTPLSQPPYTGDQDVNNLASQMGAVGLGVDSAGQPRHKKKNRHAYHNLEGPGSASPGFNGMNQGGTPPQFSPQVGGPQWQQEPEITPAPRQQTRCSLLQVKLRLLNMAPEPPLHHTRSEHQ